MMKTITKFMTLCALFVGVNVSAQTLSADYEVLGYKVKAFYDLSADSEGKYVPLEGDVMYRDAARGIYNYGGGARPVTLKFPVSNGDLVFFEGGSTSATKAYEVTFGTKEEQYSNSSVLAFTSTSDMESLSFTINKNNYIKYILVMEKDNTLATADYTLRYIDGEGNEFKTTTLSGVVTSTITLVESNKTALFNSDKTKKYIYVSDDSEGKTIASDGSTVVTVTCREAETYSYSVKSSTGTTIAEGANFEGESITTPYPMYVNEDGVLYQADADNQQYNHVFTLTTNAQEEVITYNETEIVDVVMLVEAETLLGMTPSAGNGGTATIRSSNAKVAYPAEDVQIITIPAGKYRIVVDIYGGQKALGELTMTIGEASHTFTSVSQTYHSIQSWDVELTKEESPLMALKGGGNGVAYDFIYIIKTGNVTPISDINADKAVDNDYYDLSGRKVVNPVKGNIYINGGKLIRY